MLNSINIAILGNSTTDYLETALIKECKKHEIAASIYNAPYNQYAQEILNNSSGYYSSKPDLTIIMLEGKELFPEWYSFATLQESNEHKVKLVEETYNSLASLLEIIHTNCNTKIIISNFKIPYYSPLGILDTKSKIGLKRMISTLNLKLEEFSAARDYVYIFDYTGLSSQYGYNNSEDAKMYYIAKNTVSFSFINQMAKEYMRYILPLESKNKKCLVLDLDNTLWGGVAGEDGINGVRLDSNGAARSFYDFQLEILSLYYKGVVLAVNSKNNYEDAMEIIEKHPHMLLRKKYFSVLKINWQDKAANMKEIAGELNLGIDSLVFFDDNPVERDYVKSMLPEVKAVDVPEDVSKYSRALQELVEFEQISITSEDIKRNEMYEANQKRQEAQAQYDSLEDYLAGLGSVISLENASEFTIPRITQLSQKTNQFNMTTVRYQTDDIAAMLETNKYLVLSCSAKDKFGDNGIVGVCIVKLDNIDAYIDTFLLSCRVLGRNIEYAFISSVADILRGRGIQNISAKYIKTGKNVHNKDFYLNAGFSKLSETEAESNFMLGIKDKLKEFKYIDIISI